MESDEPVAGSASSTGAETFLPDPPSRLLIRRGDRAFFVATHAIRWIQADDDFVRLHVAGSSHKVRSTLTGLLARLDPQQFLRIHRSAIVNVAFIAEIRIPQNGACQVLLLDGTVLKLSRPFRTVAQELGCIFEADERQ